MKHRGFSMTAIVLLVVFTLVVIVFYAITKQELQISLGNNSQITNQNLHNKNGEPSPINTNDWNLYENDKYSFQFKYPAEYHIEEEQSIIKVIETPIGKSSFPDFDYEPYSFYSYLVVKNNTNNYTPEEYFINELCYEGVAPDENEAEWPKMLKQGCVNLFNESKESYIVANIEGILGTYNPYEHGHPIFVFIKGDKIYAFHLGNTGETGHFPDENQITLFKEILSTFEFIK